MKPKIVRIPNISTDFTTTQNMGNGSGKNVNDPMDASDMMVMQFARAIRPDYILTDTLRPKNPFKPRW